MQMRSIAVLTQFNLEPPPHWMVPRRCLETDWLERRIDLLERTSLPSLQSQTRKEFYWVIFIHPESPNWLRRTLSHDPSDGILRRLVSVEGFDGIDYGSLLKDVLPESEWLTIKLDSDDLLSKEFLERADDNTEVGTYCFEDGAYLDVRTMRAYRRRYPSNPFPFRISTEGKSALDEGHHVIKIDFRIRTTAPMWMQFHHGENVSPDWIPLRTLQVCELKDCFNFPESSMVQEPPRNQFILLGECVKHVWKRFRVNIEMQIGRIVRKIRHPRGARGR